MVILIKSGCDSLCRRKSGRIPEFSSGISGKLYNSLHRNSSHIRYKLLNFSFRSPLFLTYKCIIDHLKADYVPNEKKKQTKFAEERNYEEKKENLHLHSRIARYESPHLHNSVEFIYLTEGCLELGMGQELFHMEEGDFAVLFPEVIHHCQVFSGENNKACYLWAQPILCGQFASVMQKYCPKNPVIKKPQVHRDIVNAILCLKLDKKEQNPNLVVEQAYVQILLARSIPAFNLQEKSSVESNDIIYQTVSYIAKHFKEEMSLEKMARDMGVSKFTLSRVFSGTFHRNFNQYLNEQRLNYVCVHLECTDKSITDISMDAGFESQRTFNRVFRERYKMTPREYRNLYREKFVLQNEII